MRELLGTAKARQEIVENGITLDCSEICLTQNATKEPRIWHLSGSLEFDVREGITARLFSTDPDRPRNGIHEFFKQMNQVRSGEFFPPHSYYSLQATDVDGNVWVSEHVHLEEKDHHTHSVVSIKSGQIELITPEPDHKEYARLIFVDEFNIPQNFLAETETKSDNHSSKKNNYAGSEGMIGNASIRFIKSDGSPFYCDLIAKPTEGKSLPVNFPYKMVETLRFLTGQMISFAMSESVHAGVRRIIFAQTSSIRSGISFSPISTQRRYATDFYRLMDCYLNYTYANSKGEDFSFLSIKLHPLHNLKYVSLDAVALLVSVTIEAVIQKLFKKVGSVPPQDIIEVEQISTSINALLISEHMKTRAKSSLGGMKNLRAVDRLYVLQTQGKILANEISGWKSLRDVSAHGSMRMAETDNQELLDNVYNAATLLNKLIFLAIGYSGTYTDYSTRGWPERTFNPTVAEPIVPNMPAT